MTRGTGMTETRWSMNTASTPADTMDDVEATSAPSISSYRAMYRHATPIGTLPSGVGVAGSSPDNHALIPMPTAIAPSALPFESSTDSYEYSPSDWAFRTGNHHHHHHNYPLDLARVQIKPNTTNTSVSRSESDLFKRSVNERLDRYMVVRQRTFHGLPRSKSDMSKLPLTDPRETMSEGSTPTWLHRSKTDLYIEKWRSKIGGRNRHQSMSGSSSLDLSGMTVGSLYESLPSSRLEKSHSSSPRASIKEIKTTPRLTTTATKVGVASNGSETRFPPLSPKMINQTVAAESGGRLANLHEKLGNDHTVDTIPASAPSPTKELRSANRRKTSSSNVLRLPSENEEGTYSAHHKNNPTRTAIVGGSGGCCGEMGNSSAAANDANIGVNLDSAQRLIPDGGEASGEHPSLSNSSWKSRGTMGDPEKRLGKDVAAIPLQLWEPSFSSGFVGGNNAAFAANQKGLQPRHLVRAWQQTGGHRHGVLK